jgi:hypothetical protein
MGNIGITSMTLRDTVACTIYAKWISDQFSGELYDSNGRKIAISLADAAWQAADIFCAARNTNTGEVEA